MLHISGKVRIGKKRGKEFGFPTANVLLHKKIPYGIYVSKTKIKENFYNSLTFIGNVTTFDEKVILSETYIFDFDKTIYNTWITIKLLKKLRESIKFSSEKELIQQMNKDKEDAQKFFQENKYV